MRRMILALYTNDFAYYTFITNHEDNVFPSSGVALTRESQDNYLSTDFCPHVDKLTYTRFATYTVLT